MANKTATGDGDPTLPDEVCSPMPRFSSVDVLFTRTPEGWTFNSPYPRFFGRPSIYLRTEAQKETLENRLNRFVLRSTFLVFMFVALVVVPVLVSFPDFLDQLEAGSPEAWLLACAVYIVPMSALILPAVFFVRHRILQLTLGAARCIGPAQPDRLGFIFVKKVIMRYTERKSVKVLIILTTFLFVLSTYATISYALVPARTVLTLFGIVLTWLVTLWYAALLVFKLRSQRG